MSTNATGKITQVIGAVVDVQFEGDLPPILNALHTQNGEERLLETFLLLKKISSNIAMDSTEGPRQGSEVIDTGDAKGLVG